MRSYFSKCDGALGTNGSLEFIFNRKGVFTLLTNTINIDIEELEMELIDAGLEELEINEEEAVIYCDYTEFNNIQTKLEGLNIKIENAELQRVPNNLKEISLQQAEKVLKLLDLLEENDDVQQVFHNMLLTEEIVNAINN